MAKSRYVKDSIRSDNWFTDLTVSEKLLFTYLLTNDKVGLCGVYELPLKKIQRETGIDSGTLGKAFERFESVGKVCYRDGRVMIVNFLKNQSMNDNMVKGAKREAESISQEVWLSFANFKGFERLGKDFECFDILNLTLLNLTLPNSTIPDGVSEEAKVEKKENLKSDYILKTWKQASDLLNDGGYVGLSIPLRRSEDLEKARKVLEKKGVTDEEWVQGLRNYVKDIEKRNKEQSYATHRFKLLEFLTRKGGLVTFI